MDARKAYGALAAIGTRIGERARTSGEDLRVPLRATTDAAAFRAGVRSLLGDALPAAVVDPFLDEVVTDADWTLWKSRLLIQVRMTMEGRKPAPGHEKGKGVGRP